MRLRVSLRRRDANVEREFMRFLPRPATLAFRVSASMLSTLLNRPRGAAHKAYA
jgi:hypothetical protein